MNLLLSWNDQRVSNHMSATIVDEGVCEKKILELDREIKESLRLSKEGEQSQKAIEEYHKKRNAFYSQRKYYKKKYLMSQLLEDQKFLEEKNAAMRAENEQLESILSWATKQAQLLESVEPKPAPISSGQPSASTDPRNLPLGTSGTQASSRQHGLKVAQVDREFAAKTGTHSPPRSSVTPAYMQTSIPRLVRRSGHTLEYLLLGDRTGASATTTTSPTTNPQVLDQSMVSPSPELLSDLILRDHLNRSAPRQQSQSTTHGLIDATNSQHVSAWNATRLTSNSDPMADELLRAFLFSLAARSGLQKLPSQVGLDGTTASQSRTSEYAATPTSHADLLLRVQLLLNPNPTSGLRQLPSQSSTFGLGGIASANELYAGSTTIPTSSSRPLTDLQLLELFLKSRDTVGEGSSRIIPHVAAESPLRGSIADPLADLRQQLVSGLVEQDITTNGPRPSPWGSINHNLTSNTGRLDHVRDMPPSYLPVTQSKRRKLSQDEQQARGMPGK
jgi:hypothetical protein